MEILNFLLKGEKLKFSYYKYLKNINKSLIFSKRLQRKTNERERKKNEKSNYLHWRSCRKFCIALPMKDKELK